MHEHRALALRAGVAAVEVHAQALVVCSHGLGDFLPERVEEAAEAELLRAQHGFGRIGQFDDSLLAFRAFIETN